MSQLSAFSLISCTKLHSLYVRRVASRILYTREGSQEANMLTATLNFR